MPNKMQRFTQRARRVLELAQQEAEDMHHALIGTEHMLVALMVEEGGVAGRVLRDLGLELKRVRELAAEITSFPVRDAADKTPVELSPSTKRAMELAVDEARRMGHHYIGTEHLLLGLVRMDDSTAVGVLKRLDISQEDVRQQTRRVLQENPVDASAKRIMERASLSVRPAPPPPPAVTQIGTPAYHVVKAVIIKLLDMVGEGKLTLEQAQELLASVQPGLRLTTGMQTWLASLLNQKLEDDTRHIEVVVTNLEADTPVHTLTLPLSEALRKLDQLLLVTVTDNRLESVAFESDTSTIKVEVRIVKE